VAPLFREPLYLVGAVVDALCGEGPITREQLRGRALLSLDRRHHFSRQCVDIAAEYGMIVSPEYEGTSLDTLHQMAAMSTH
jgi:LysR family transcriptional regulator, hydrogen peroxide-inducible genes activator